MQLVRHKVKIVLKSRIKVFFYKVLLVFFIFLRIVKLWMLLTDDPNDFIY